MIRKQCENKSKKSYKATPDRLKKQLIYKVLVENRSIKYTQFIQAAKHLRINYSTAKTIIRISKNTKNTLLPIFEDTNYMMIRSCLHASQCKTRERIENQITKIQLISSFSETKQGGYKTAGIRQFQDVLDQVRRKNLCIKIISNTVDSNES